jgi:hypothetical protein
LLRWIHCLLACPALGIAGAACRGPSVAFVAPQEQAGLYVDAQRLPAGVRSGPLPYYGTAAIDVVVPDADAMLPMRHGYETAELPEPVTPWLFPLDFVVELVSAPWRERDLTVRVSEPAARPPVVAKRPYPRAGELMARARAARVQR